jgi:hypothetical protein
MPLLRPLGLSGRMYGPGSDEVAVFADAGSGWNRGERPSFLAALARWPPRRADAANQPPWLCRGRIHAGETASSGRTNDGCSNSRSRPGSTCRERSGSSQPVVSVGADPGVYAARGPGTRSRGESRTRRMGLRRPIVQRPSWRAIAARETAQRQQILSYCMTRSWPRTRHPTDASSEGLTRMRGRCPSRVYSETELARRDCKRCTTAGAFTARHSPRRTVDSDWRPPPGPQPASHRGRVRAAAGRRTPSPCRDRRIDCAGLCGQVG